MSRLDDIKNPGVILESKVVRFPELRDALIFNGAYCWLPVGIQLAFELYRWMLASADERGDKWAADRWAHRRYPDILAYIGGEGVGGVNVTSTAPFGPHWREDLPRRLLNAMRHGGVVAQWRREQGIDPDGSRRIPVLVYNNPLGEPGTRRTYHGGVGEVGVAKAIDALFELWSPERRLIPQLNPSHPDARRVTRVGFGVREGRWYAAMEYGYDGSSWSAGRHGARVNPLGIDQRPGEPFYDFILRARRHLERVLTPRCAYRRPPRDRSPSCNGNWTGITSEGVEFVGGRKLAEHVKVWKASGIAPGPVLLKGEKKPRMVEDRAGAKWVPSDRSWPLSRTLAPNEYIEGRVRFELRLEGYRRGYLDLTAEERSLADGFIAPGQNGYGSALRALEEAARFSDNVRPTPFEDWCPEGASYRCEP